MKWMKKQDDNERNVLGLVIAISLMFAFFIFLSKDEKLDGIFLQLVFVGIVEVLYFIDYLFIRISYNTLLKNKDELIDFYFNRFWKIYLTSVTVSSIFVTVASFFSPQRTLLMLLALALNIILILLAYTENLKLAYELERSLPELGLRLIKDVFFLLLAFKFNPLWIALFLGTVCCLSLINFRRIQKVRKYGS